MEIKDIYGKVLFTCEASSMAELVEMAVKAGANLYEANLSGANLYMANLSRADLSGANLSGADLSGANLYRANLYMANLSGADLSMAYLSEADLSGADLSGVDLSEWKICPEVGSFRAFKKVKTPEGVGVVLEIRIDSETPRINGIGSRKCRAERVFVVRAVTDTKCVQFISPTSNQVLVYNVGEYTVADRYNDDPRLECTDGIHFFMTAREAEAWSL